jgi:hypothetical protein
MLIKLSNLAEATKQQVFDQVVNHLLTQNQVSVASGAGFCAYRGGNQLMCAAGCLIGDDEYNSEMDGAGDTSWSGLIASGLVKTKVHHDLIADLQLIHDGDNPEVWLKALKALAGEHNLSFNFVTPSETV